MDLDELMVNCLRMHSWDRKKAIKEFLQDFRVMEKLKKNHGYANVVYERVLKKHPMILEGKSELANSLRRALLAVEEKAVMTGNWVEYIAFVEKYAKILGMDKDTNINMNQFNLSSNTSVDQLLERIKSNEQRIGSLISPISEGHRLTGSDQEDGSCITISTKPEAEVGSSESI